MWGLLKSKVPSEEWRKSLPVTFLHLINPHKVLSTLGSYYFFQLNMFVLNLLLVHFIVLECCTELCKTKLLPSRFIKCNNKYIYCIYMNDRFNGLSCFLYIILKWILPNITVPWLCINMKRNGLFRFAIVKFRDICTYSICI